MLGPEINSSCILFGAIIGSYIGRLLGETFRKNLMLVFGCINIGMGVFMISKTQALPPSYAPCCSERSSARCFVWNTSSCASPIKCPRPSAA